MEVDDPQVALGRRLSVSLLQEPETAVSINPPQPVVQSPLPGLQDIPQDVASRLSSLSDFRISFALTDVASILKYVLSELNLTKAKMGDMSMQLDQAESRRQAAEEAEAVLSQMVERQQESIKELTSELQETKKHVKSILSLDDEVETDVEVSVDEQPEELGDEPGRAEGENGKEVGPEVDIPKHGGKGAKRRNASMSVSVLLARKREKHVASIKTCARAINRLAKRLATLDGSHSVAINPSGHIVPELSKEELLNEDTQIRAATSAIEVASLEEAGVSQNLEGILTAGDQGISNVITSSQVRISPIEDMQRSVVSNANQLDQIQKKLEELVLNQSITSSDMKQLMVRSRETDGKLHEICDQVERDHNILCSQFLSNPNSSSVPDPKQAFMTSDNKVPQNQQVSGSSRLWPGVVTSNSNVGNITSESGGEKDKNRSLKVEMDLVTIFSRIENLQQEMGEVNLKMRSGKNETQAVRDELASLRRAQSEVASRGSVEELTVQFVESSKLIARVDKQLSEVCSKLEAEETMLNGAPSDLASIRRAITASGAKQRHLQDKLDALSALSLTTRRQVAQLGTLESSPFFKSLNLRIHEFEIRFTELEDKLMLIAHFLSKRGSEGGVEGITFNDSMLNPNKQHYNGESGNQSAAMKVIEQGRVAVQQAGEGKALSTNESELQMRLLSRASAPTLQKSLAEVAKDIETLSDLQTRLEDARAVLERLSSLAALESKVQTLLDLEVPYRLQQMERKLNTEVSFLKSHLSSKVDQSNVKVMVSRLDALLNAVNRTAFTVPAFVVANHEGVDLETVASSGNIIKILPVPASASPMTRSFLGVSQQTSGMNHHGESDTMHSGIVSNALHVSYGDPMRTTQKLLESTSKAKAHGVAPSPNPSPTSQMNGNGTFKASRSSRASIAHVQPIQSMSSPTQSHGSSSINNLSVVSSNPSSKSGNVINHHQVSLSLVADSRDNERLISMLMLKADGASVNKVEELVRALDRQQRDALVKALSEIQLLKRAVARLTKAAVLFPNGHSTDIASSTGVGSGSNVGNSSSSGVGVNNQEEIELGFNSMPASAAPLGVALGYDNASLSPQSKMSNNVASIVNLSSSSNGSTLTGPAERLVRQFELLQVQVSALESRLGQKVDAESIEEMQSSLLDRVIDLVRHQSGDGDSGSHLATNFKTRATGSTGSDSHLQLANRQSTPEALIVRIHDALDDHEKRLGHHKEWIARNVEDIASLRAWAKAAHTLLNEHERERGRDADFASPRGSVKSLEKQVNTIRKQVASLLPSINGSSTMSMVPALNGAAATIARPKTQQVGRVSTFGMSSNSLSGLRIPGSTSFVHPAHAASPQPLPGILIPSSSSLLGSSSPDHVCSPDPTSSTLSARCMSCALPIERMSKFANTMPIHALSHQQQQLALSASSSPTLTTSTHSIVPAGGFAGDFVRRKYVTLLGESGGSTQLTGDNHPGASSGSGIEGRRRKAV